MNKQLYTFKDIGKIVTGKTPPTIRVELFGEDYPFITPSDIPTFKERYLSNTERGLSADGYKKMQSIVLPPASVCVVCIGSTIGKICLTSKECITNQQLNSIIINKNKFNPLYIYYAIRNYIPEIKVITGGTGAGKSILNKTSFGNLEISLDENKDIQTKIAKILSNYDDLIENNNRRIKILEEMAHKIYKEWFVDFKFPGHETTTFKDSELGKIPSNWEIKEVSDISKLYKGKSYKSSELCNKGEGLPFLNLKCIERDGGFKRDGLKYFNGKYNNNHIVYPEDIIMAVTDMTQERRLVARPARIPHNWYKKYVMSMDLVKLIPSDNMERSYLYSLLKYSNFSDEVKNHANGANVLHLNPKNIEQFELVVADKNTRDKFEEIVNQIYSEIDVLYLKNENLKQTRDILLPRLIAGEIDVEKMEVL